MNNLLNFMKWAIAAVAIIALVVIYSCSEDEPEPVDPPGFSYAASTIEVGTAGSVIPAVNGGEATYALTDVGNANFVTINANHSVKTVFYRLRREILNLFE